MTGVKIGVFSTNFVHYVMCAYNFVYLLKSSSPPNSSTLDDDETLQLESIHSIDWFIRRVKFTISNASMLARL